MVIPESEVAKAREVLEKVFGKENPKFNEQFAELLATLEKNEVPNPVGHGIPAVFGNRFHIWVDAEIVRFIIGDAVSNETPDQRGAFTLPRSVAKDLAQVLLQLLAQTEQPKSE